MDKRDNLLDKLSKKFGITVKRQDKEAIDLKADAFQNPTNIINNLVNSNPMDEDYTRFSYVKEAKVNAAGSGVEVTYYPLGNSEAATKTITITSANPKV